MSNESNAELLKDGSIILVQPVVPTYRIGFFGRLAEAYGTRFTVFASATDMGVLTSSRKRPAWEARLGPIRRIFPGVEWQQGIFGIKIKPEDIVVVSGAPRCLSNIALLVKAKCRGARTVWWGHYWSSTSKWWRAALRMPLMSLADGVIFYTEHEVAEYRSRFPGKANRAIFALNNGIETSEIVNFRVRYDPSKRIRHLLFIGRLVDKAELETLFLALADPRCSTLTLDIIGGGEAEARWRSLSTRLGISDRIVWHGGISNEQEIARIANRCRLFVYPGPVGLSLIHAFSYGLPAVVHDDRWTHGPEFAALKIGRNGFTFLKGNSASLAQVLDEMLSDPARLSDLSAAALETTAVSYNAEDMANRFSAAITSLKSPGISKDLQLPNEA